MGEDTVRPDHILLVLVDLPDSGASQVLEAMTVSPNALYDYVRPSAGSWGRVESVHSGGGEPARVERIASTLLPELNRVLDLAEEVVDAGGRRMDLGDVVAVLLTRSGPRAPRSLLN
jgi:hypothetical protein